MKLCDLTQFYSPLSGGVKRYLHEKIAFLQRKTNDEHVLVIPGEKSEWATTERSRVYSIHSPLISRASQYRALLNLRAIEQILERERPDIVECGDPYQVAWKAIASGEALRLPVVGFYHSHFPEAYLRSAGQLLGRTVGEAVMDFAQRYVRSLYNRFEVTLVPSEKLATVLRGWGVRNVRAVNLGVDTEIFSPSPDDASATRAELGIPDQQQLLLYVGRLAPEKNTKLLFRAFEILRAQFPKRFHLLIIGDGNERKELADLQRRAQDEVTWRHYSTESNELARFYRAADLFVHPGIQETFGLVAVESQACGTPVLGIRGSYMDRIILHEQDCWADENTPSSLAGAIATICARDLGRLGSKAARQVERDLSWTRVFGQIFSIYAEICSRFRKGVRNTA